MNVKQRVMAHFVSCAPRLIVYLRSGRILFQGSPKFLSFIMPILERMRAP